MSKQHIHFTKTKLDAFREKYAKALMSGRDTFRFEGIDIYVPYARYLIEYLDSRITGIKLDMIRKQPIHGNN